MFRALGVWFSLVPSKIVEDRWTANATVYDCNGKCFASRAKQSDSKQKICDTGDQQKHGPDMNTTLPQKTFHQLLALTSRQHSTYYQ